MTNINYYVNFQHKTEQLGHSTDYATLQEMLEEVRKTISDEEWEVTGVQKVEDITEFVKSCLSQ